MDRPEGDPLDRALGPLAPLYRDPAVSEILVDRPDRAYAVRAGVYLDLPGLFADAEQLRATIDQVFGVTGVSIGDGRTVAETRLPDGSRFIAVVPPTSGDAPCLVLRRLSAEQPSWDELVERRVLSAEARALLAGLARLHVGVLCAGDASSAKETLANLLAEAIPPDRRVVVIQDVIELPVRHARAVHLEANVHGTTVGVEELLDAAARLKPDRIVVCQLRGRETLRALEVLSSGPAGVALVHAMSVDDALRRLEVQCRMGTTALGPLDIRRLITSAFGFLVLLEQLPIGLRVVQIAELRLSGNEIEAQPLLRYNAATDALQLAGIASAKRVEDLTRAS